MGTNQTTVDPATTRPGSFEPGGAFGPPGTTNLGTNNQGNNNQGNNQGFNEGFNQGMNTLPGNFIGGVGSQLAPGDAQMMAGNPSQQTVVIQQPSSPARPATPLLDQSTREAQARETRRRNAKQEPRIIGIAPNTDRDLTNQMPDDRIIRY